MHYDVFMRYINATKTKEPLGPSAGPVTSSLLVVIYYNSHVRRFFITVQLVKAS